MHPEISASSEGTIEWNCPSNIALVKYWGKKGDQQPVNPSVSMTLTKCFTRLKAEYKVRPGKPFHLELLFEGKENPLFKDRIVAYFEKLIPFFPFITNLQIKLDSSNSFPHSSGIASSASFFGAAALVLCSIPLRGNSTTEGWSFLRKSSFTARLGSGSACRSVFGGLVIWGKTTHLDYSSDEAAYPLNDENRLFSGFRDSVLIVSSASKSVSSSRGHDLMKNHLFGKVRVDQAGNNLTRLLHALDAGDINEFLNVAEIEALTLHALMMTSDPGYLLLRPGTLEIMERVREYRRTTGQPVGFTLDAGPNVHVLYPDSVKESVLPFIEKDLLDFCEERKVIHDFMGNGPVKTI